MKHIPIQWILFAGMLLFTQSCNLKNTAAHLAEQDKQQKTKQDEPMQIAKEYENEYGKVTILNKEGSKVVLMTTGHSLSRGLMVNASTDGLSNSECVVQFEEGKLRVRKAAENSNVEHFAERPFYVMNSRVKIKGIIHFSKGGATINGIYLKDYPNKASRKGVQVEGLIKREPYPRAYYSTPESPQGMFADDGKVHYRLILEDYNITDLPKEIFEGTCMNQDGKAYFIWDMADSAIYLLDEAALWTAEELNKKIKIEAVAITLENGSTLLCNWKIIK